MLSIKSIKQANWFADRRKGKITHVILGDSTRKLSREILGKQENAILVSIYLASYKQAVNSLDELRELAATGGINVLDTVLQQRKR